MKKIATQDRREKLIQSAQTLFAKKNFEAVSLHEIARKSEVNVALVKYYFGNKKGLYKACLETYATEKINFLRQYVLDPHSLQDFKDRLAIFLDQMLTYEIKNPEAGCIIRRDVESENPMVLDVFKKTILKLYEAFVSFLESGQKKGFIRKDIRPQMMASLFLGGIQQEIRTDKIRKKFYGKSIRQKDFRNEVIQSALNMFFDGVLR
jgi:TetR/AcrR family transcriptional regulator